MVNKLEISFEFEGTLKDSYEPVIVSVLAYFTPDANEGIEVEIVHALDDMNHDVFEKLTTVSKELLQQEVAVRGKATQQWV